MVEKEGKRPCLVYTENISKNHPGGLKGQKLLLATKDLTAGKYKLLFNTPEAIVRVEKWKEILQTSPLSEKIVAVAVDEAHCVSKW